MTWSPTTTTTAEWGQIRVTIDGKDRTFFRDLETRVLDWQDTDPYGSNNARIAFPQVTEFDAIGEGDLDWLDVGKHVRIDHHNNGVRVKNLFVGFIDRLEITDAGLTATCKGDLLGRLALSLHQPPIGRRRVSDIGEAISRELGTYDGVGRFTLIPQAGVETGILTANRGSRDMTRLGFVDYLLGMAVKADGSSLTILPDPTEDATTYRQQWRDLTTVQAVLSAGAHGVKVNLSRDIIDSPNRIFGEGVSTTGERYRNAKYPKLHNDAAPTYPFTDNRTFGVGTTNADTDTGAGITVLARELAAGGDLAAEDRYGDTYTQEMAEAVEAVQERAGLTVTGGVDPTTWGRIFNVADGPQSFAGAMFWPFAQDKTVTRFLRSNDGTVIGLNPDHDPKVIPVEHFEAFGESVPKRRARRAAKAMLNRQGGWAGTITLTQDPGQAGDSTQPFSRFDLRAGNNIRLRHLKGTGSDGLRLHISSVQVDWQSGAVTLAVATRGRHFLDLATRKQRNLDARRDPGFEFRHMLRQSARVSDSISGWEGESAAGVITPTALMGGTWNMLRTPAAELGTLGDLKLETDIPTTFYVGVFADKVNAAVLNDKLGDPSVWVNKKQRIDVWMANDDWLLEDERLLIEAWGTPDQPCGLGNKPYLDEDGNRSEHPITGKHRDRGSWDFWTADNFLYLAVWTPVDCTISGRMRIQLNDGM